MNSRGNANSINKWMKTKFVAAITKKIGVACATNGIAHTSLKKAFKSMF